MGLGWEVTQVAEVFNEGPPSLVGENVVDAGRVGALRGAVPVLEPPVSVLEVVRGSLGDVSPAVLEHVEEVRVAVNVGIGVHTYEVGGGPNSGSGTVSKSKDIGAVTSRAAVNTGDVEAGWPEVISSPPASALSTERLKHLVPAFGGLETRHACRGVVSGRINDSIFGKDGNTTVVTRGTRDGVVSTTMGGFTD